MGKYSFCWLILAILYATPSFSQSKVRGSVRGVVADSAAGKAPLPNATISIRPVGGDSTTAEYAVSNKQGAFLFRGLPVGQYFVLITFEGYAHAGRNVRITDSSANVDMGTFLLQHSTDLLEAAIVQRPPIGIKKDTVEYNAGSFAVKPNATAEDLLNKMPGITVDHSGAVTAQGETVQRVLVNGKRFFSDDPKLATRNLPPDVIDKIQVFDDLSDQSKFTGFDDGNRVKTINIITKKNARKGYFGRFIGAGGTNEDYDESVNLHRFNGNEQISVLGQGNDINKQNFTAQDILGSGGGRRGGGPSASSSYQSSGVTTVWAGGANYRNTLGTDPNHSTDIYGSYFYNFQHVLQTQTDSAISPVPNNYGADSSLVTNGGNTGISRISSHRIYLNVESRIDSNNSIIFRPNVTFEKSTPNGSSFSAETDNHGNLVNSLNGYTSSENTGFQVNGSNLELRHRFAKPYRTISLDINATANTNNGFGYTYSVNNFYFPLHKVDTINQFYNDSLHAWTLTPTLSYTEPIAKDQILQFSYSHTYNTSTSINNTYDYDDFQKSFSHFDYLFSNSYKFRSNADNAGLYWRIQHSKYNLSVGSGIQWTNFTSINTTKDTTVARNYVNFTPSVNFHYNLSNTRHLRVFYRGSTGTPSPSQLQPLVTTSDSVNFQLGNPALKPQFTHSLRVLYANFDPSTQRVMFATVNASTIINDIQNVSYYNKEGGKNNTYANLSGTWNVSGFFNYGFPLKRPKSNLNFMTNVNYSQSQTGLATDSASYLAGQFTHLYTKTTTLNERIRWTTNIKKNFDMNFTSSTGYTINKIPGLPQMNPQSDTSKTGGRGVSSNSNLNSFTEGLTADLTAYTNSGWLFAATFDYTYTYTNSKTFNASVPLFTPSIAKQLFKKKNGELRLTVFDLFNKNTIVTKTVSAGATSYNRTNVLTRYAMLTFTYNLNKFPDNERRRFGPEGGPRFFGRPGGGFRGGPLYPID